MVIGIGEAAAVVTTLKNATDLVAKLRNSVSKEEIQSGVAAITEMLVGARLAALDLVEQKAVLMDERTALTAQVKDLEAELRRLSDFDLVSGKYERVQMPSSLFVFREKGVENSPLLCPHCFTEQKIRILQQNADATYAQCHTCKFGEYLRKSDWTVRTSGRGSDY